MKTENTTDKKQSDLALGIDIGTTTISATLLDLTYKRQVEVWNIPNDSRLYSKDEAFAQQDAEAVLKKACELTENIVKKYEGIVSLGVTGQMHGIVYIDKEGKVLSPLMTWQDKRADTILPQGESCCEIIERTTGEKIASGYGIATHYYNQLCGLVPKDSTGFCSIMDCLVMVLTGNKAPIVHSSVAASFGLFDAYNHRFMTEKLGLLNINESFLPNVTSENAVCGSYKGIPVSVAIGDNQASFLGSVKTPKDIILINIGTGSQISMMTDYRKAGKNTELRPFVGGKYLLCGSALCGGYAYAMLERFSENTQ